MRGGIVPHSRRLGIENMRAHSRLALSTRTSYAWIGMACISDNTEDEKARRRSPPGNDIPVRRHYRPPRRALTPTQPTIKGHAIRLAIASVIGIVLMFVLLMLAVQYAQRDWNRKNQRARTSHAPAPAAAETAGESAPAPPPGWTFEPPPSATRRCLRNLTADRFIANSWLVLARGLSGQPHPGIQESSLRMAMAVGGEDAEIKNDLGALYLQQKRIPEAAAQFRAADQIRPGFAPARFNLALCAIASRTPAQAIQLLGQYLGQRPADTTALRLQATLLAQVGRSPDALRMLEKFLKTQPPDQPLFLEAAVLAARLGQNGNAIRYLETAMNGNPIQAVIRTYQSTSFREIRLSGDGDRLASRLADKARVAFSAPAPAEDVQPLRATTPEAKIR